MHAIHRLTETSLEQIHGAFEDAFSEYEVKMSMPLERLAEMLKTRSYRADLSLGYFVEGSLVGFVLVGFRSIGSQNVCYDAGTGVIRSFQNQGIGDKLLEALKGMLRDEGVERFVLEVLVNNRAAQKLYEKHGFRRTRRLCCFEIPRRLSPVLPGQEFVVDQARSVLEGVSEARYNQFAPSWQNTLASYAQVREKHVVRTLSLAEELIGYGIIHQERGGILQIAVLPEYLRVQTVSVILGLLAESTEAEKLTFLNVESGSLLEEILLGIGFTRTVDQFEMELVL